MRDGESQKAEGGSDGRRPTKAQIQWNLALEERFWSRVDKSDGCWLWTGPKNGYGYGAFYYRRLGYGAHRIAYELMREPIPDGLVIDHLCRNRACVRPDHLEVVTHAVNLMRGQGITALRASSKSCPSGHPYEGDNLVIDSRGYRHCRSCQRLADARNRWKRRGIPKRLLESGDL